MSKLSERFKREVVKIEESKPIVVETNPLTEVLLEKVNSVPYWNEYTVDEQCDMVRSFVKNADVEDKDSVYDTIVPYVIAFGPLQKLLDNEKVSAVLVNNDKSVHIEIEGRVFDTEMKLSHNMFQYVLNYIKYSDETSYIIDVKADESLTIRKF